MDEATLAAMIERGEIEPDEIQFGMPNTIYIPDECTDPEAYIAERNLINERLMILKEAHFRFSCLSKVSYNSGLDFEHHYQILYDDIMEHYGLWFDKIFNVDTRIYVTKTEFTVGILGTYCTILRQRGDLNKCNEVMDTYMKVLKRYQQMTEGCGRPATIACCEGLTYKANIIRINLGVQLPDMKMTVQAFHDAVAFERKEKALGRYDVDTEPDNDGVMEMWFGHTDYDKVTDEDIFKAYKFMTEDREGGETPLQLGECGCCDKKEEKYGDFKRCARCHQQPYCSKKCQTKDWKIHKHLCGKKNTTNIDSEALLIITKLLVHNHTTTVENRGGKPPTEFQKDDAKLSLVKKLKQMFTGDFKQYNSNHLSNDAANDSAFCEELAKHFAKQPGYKEIWGPLSVNYKEGLEQKKSIQIISNELIVPEDVIRQYCKQMARSVVVTVGFALADENSNTSELADLTRHTKLVDALVEYSKEFILKHREYDSHAGVSKLAGNKEYQLKMSDIIADDFGIEKNEE